MITLSRIKTSCVIAAALVIAFIAPAIKAAGYGAGVLEFQMKLASNGNANAQYRLATMFESGRGTLKDNKQAMDWYKKAAAQNHKAAVNRLTYIDIRQNGFKAKHKSWLSNLEKAADNRDGEAMLLLGQMYDQGVGVNQNINNAIGLLKLAKAKGVTGAEEELDKIENQLLSARQQKRQQEKQAMALKAKQEEQRRAAAKARSQREQAERERRRHVSEQRRKTTEDKRRQQAASQAASQTESKQANQQFESDLCKGKKARFLTACQ